MQHDRLHPYIRVDDKDLEAATRRAGRRCSRRRRSARPCWKRHIVHPLPGSITRRIKPILVHQELEAHGLPSIRRHVHRLVNPGRIITHVVDRLQDVAAAIGDIGILPVERDAVVRAVHVPEAQCAAASRDRELLIEGAISERLVAVLLAVCV